jgi:hypothetical protein
VGDGRLKKISGTAGKNLSISADKTENLDIQHPVFCFKYLNKNYDLDKCEVKEKLALLDTLQFLSKKTWQQIHMAHRHDFGVEKIKQAAIKGGAIPAHLSKDEIFYALRFDKKKPMVGFKSSFVFHIVYLDRDFTLYNHG